jgi:hypothetical protein
MLLREKARVVKLTIDQMLNKRNICNSLYVRLLKVNKAKKEIADFILSNHFAVFRYKYQARIPKAIFGSHAAKIVLNFHFS